MPLHRYHYCSYWGTWSRVLCDPSDRLPGFEGCFVEVNISGVNRRPEEAAEIRIRKHFTARSYGDKETDILPLEVKSRLLADCLDVVLAARILNEDFLSQIDWVKYEKFNNGGCPLHLCKKGA